MQHELSLYLSKSLSLSLSLFRSCSRSRSLSCVCVSRACVRVFGWASSLAYLSFSLSLPPSLSPPLFLQRHLAPLLKILYQDITTLLRGLASMQYDEKHLRGWLDLTVFDTDDPNSLILMTQEAAPGRPRHRHAARHGNGGKARPGAVMRLRCDWWKSAA